MPFIPAPSRGLLRLYVQPNVHVEEGREIHENGIEEDLDEVVADDAAKNAEEAPCLRAVERNLKILPGQKVSITVGCQAK